jgi:hypothetical protein
MNMMINKSWGKVDWDVNYFPIGACSFEADDRKQSDTCGAVSGRGFPIGILKHIYLDYKLITLLLHNIRTTFQVNIKGSWLTNQWMYDWLPPGR